MMVTGGVDRPASLLVERMGPGEREIQVVTWPGFPGWEAVSTAEHLLAQHAVVHPGERVLVWPCGHGALGAWAAAETGAGQVHQRDTNWLAVQAARATAERNGRADVTVAVGLPETAPVPLDVVLLALPKGRQFARLGMLSCFRGMCPGGRLYLAGANSAGIKSAVRDCAELYGVGSLLAYKGGNRVVAFRRPEALPEPLPEAYRDPGIAPGTWQEMDEELPDGERYTFRTLPGVFSWRGLDEGTRLLLSVLSVAVDESVLDVGCGYGPIGIWAARHAPHGRVLMVDVDSLAATSARENLALNRAANAEVLLGDGVRAAHGRTFTLVVSNPPFHSGHATDLEITAGFVQQAHAVLERRGRLVVVANRFLPYDRLLQERFRRVRVLADTSRFWVLSATG